MSRFSYMRIRTWAVLGLVALFPVATGQSCFMSPPELDQASDQTTDTGTPSNQIGSTGASNNTAAPVNRGPSILFSSPAPGATFAVGDVITITFDAQDPESNFTYELFFNKKALRDGHETTIERLSKTGSSVVSRLWNTSALPAGQYFIGAAVTDNANNGDLKFTGPITLSAVSIQVTSPTASIPVTPGDSVVVSFAASNAANATVDVFFDTDRTFANGVTYIARNLAATARSAEWKTTGVADGTYFVGAAVKSAGQVLAASYAQGQVQVAGPAGPSAADLTGLSIEMIEPASGITVDRNSTYVIRFRARDTQGKATVDLFADQDAIVGNGIVKTIVAGLPVTDQSYTWTVNLDASTTPYTIGGSVGRPGGARLVAYAPGKMLVRSGTVNPPPPPIGEIRTVTLAIKTPKGAVEIGLGGKYTIEFALSDALAVGTITLYYATDNNKDNQPDGDWTRFDTRLPSDTKSVFNAESNLPPGVYLIRGHFEPSNNAPFTPADAVADGSITISTLPDIRVFKPAQNTVVRMGGTFPVEFEGREPTGAATVNLFVDGDGVFGTNDEQDLVTGLSQQRYSTQLSTFFLNPGLYFVGASIGQGAGTRTAAYAPGVVLVLATDAPAPGILTVLTPGSDTVATKGNSVVTTWFVNSAPVSGSSLLIYWQPVNDAGAPQGDPVLAKSDLDPYASIATLDTGSLAAGRYVVKAVYRRPGQPDVAVFSPGRVWIVTGESFFVEALEPSRDAVITVGTNIRVAFVANDPAGASTVNVFRDTDGRFNGNETDIVTNLQPSAGGATLPTAGWAPGMYFLGASLGRDNVSRLSSFAPGRVLVRAAGAPPVPNGTLVAISPETDLTLTQGVPLDVRWFINSTNIPADSTIRFFREGVKTSDGSPDPSGRVELIPGTAAKASDFAVTFGTDGAAFPLNTAFYLAIEYTAGGQTLKAYAPGRVRIVSNTGLTIRVTQPAKNAVVRMGTDVPMVFEGSDPSGDSTLEAFYDTDREFNRNETVFAGNLAESATTATFVTQPPAVAPGLYFLGVSIGRTATARVAGYAPGAVLLLAGNAPEPGVLTIIEPATDATVAKGTFLRVKWFVKSDPLSGQVRFFAEETNSSGTPKGTPAIPMGSFDPALSVEWLNTGGMAAGWYRIGATYAPTSGPTTTAYAGGLLHIAEEGRKTIVVSEPGRNTVLTVGANIDVRFSASDPAGDSQVNVFYDRDRVFNGNETNVPPVLGEGDAAAVIPTAGLAPGLYFVGASLGNNPAARVAGYAPGAVLLRAADAPPLGILTVLAPETDTTVLANTAINVTWFINRANPCPTVTIFYQDVDPAGRPIGTIDDKILARDVPADLSMKAVIIPESLASADPAAAKYWLIGVKYACDTEPAAIEYAPGRFRVISNTAKFVAIETPTRNVVTTVPTSRPSSQPTSAPPGSDIELTFVGIDPLGVSTIRFFYDKDGIFGTGDEVYQTNTACYGRNLVYDETPTPAVATFNAICENLQPGLYFVGAAIGQTPADRVAAYAPARFLVRPQNAPPLELLTVVAPTWPSVNISKGASFGVRWFIDDVDTGGLTPPGAVDIVAVEDINGNGILDAAEDDPALYIRPIALAPLKPYDSVYRFPTADADVDKPFKADTFYFVRVTYTPPPPDSGLPGSGLPMTRYAPGRVYIMEQGLFWVNNITTPKLRGAVFDGVNFNDMAGSSLAPVSDIDGDGIGDFVIVSQFGKPNMDNIGGAGFGEGYLIYGGTHLENKQFKLNATGVLPANTLPGLVFHGIETLPYPLPQPNTVLNSGMRPGLSGVIAVPDQDNDGAPELVFSVPKGESLRTHTLGKARHFFRGGIVMVSSQFRQFWNRTARWADGTRYVHLSGVGQQFESPGDLTAQPENVNEWGCKRDDSDGDGIPDDADGNPDTRSPCADNQRDNCDDNCPNIFNPGQEDTTVEAPDPNDPNGTTMIRVDLPGVGDVCDPSGPLAPITEDADGDEVEDAADNCPFVYNRGQSDLDGDGDGDACDTDLDGDLVPNRFDNCPGVPNDDQADTDSDGFGDACDADIDGDGGSPFAGDNRRDNCPFVYNPDQTDTDGNGVGDVCEGIPLPAWYDAAVGGFPNPANPSAPCAGFTGFGDSDCDGLPDISDNCPFVPNADQTDRNTNLTGDDCDTHTSDCDDFTRITVCAALGAPGFTEDNCAETAQDHGIGFFDTLVQDQSRYPQDFSGFPIWANQAEGTDEPCRCPVLDDWQNYLVNSLPDTVIVKEDGSFGKRPAFDSQGRLWGVYKSTGFVITPSANEFGMRLLGQGMGDMFSQGLSFVDDFLLVGAPDYSPFLAQEHDDPRMAIRPTMGRAYQIGMRNYRIGSTPLMYGYTDRNTGTQVDRNPGPRPYQYIVSRAGPDKGTQRPTIGYHYPSGDDRPFFPTYLIDNVGTDWTRRRPNEKVGYDIKGTPDFNGDVLGDIVLGAPGAFNRLIGSPTADDSGAVYLIYRRDTLLDGDRDLRDIELGRFDGDRLFGVMIRGRAGERFGKVVGTGMNNNGRALNFDTNRGPVDIGDVLDLNGDGWPDIVMGNQHFDEDRGEVVVLFGRNNLQSPAGGFRIEDVNHPDPADPAHTPDLVNDRLGLVIQGEAKGDLAGFNVGFAGDFDGDGRKDLLVSAPGASPLVDVNGDGTAERLDRAGKVYLILGSNVEYFRDLLTDPARPSLKLQLSEVGKSIKGLVFAGREPGDQLGGGEIQAYDASTGLGLGTTGMRARNISWAGDVNHDGYDDILIGAPMANVGDDQGSDGAMVRGGEVYLIFGFPME